MAHDLSRSALDHANPAVERKRLSGLVEISGQTDRVVVARASPGRRVTQGDVARVAGVHSTTVSLALRDSPALPPETRLRIKKLALEMGYFPDPMLQALVSYREACRGDRPLRTIAVLTNGPTEWGWRDCAPHEEAFVGMQHRAQELGFALEHFWLGCRDGVAHPPGLPALTASAPGFLLMANSGGTRPWEEMDGSLVHAVQVGHWSPDLPFTRVKDDEHATLKLALERVSALGYSRPGLVISAVDDDSRHAAWSVYFAAERMRACGRLDLPALTLQNPRGGGSREALATWCIDCNPDVVLGLGSGIFESLQDVNATRGREIGYADLRLSPGSALAGVTSVRERIGQCAVDLLVGLLRQNEGNRLRTATCLSLTGPWRDGAGLRRVSGSTRLASC